MSMLIIGVNPPKSCYACSWYNKVECPVNDGRYYYRAQRHPSCPLIELPPHGRLIDADAFKETIDYYIREAGWPDAHNEALGWVKEFIDNEQAVIEAEGSET